MKSWIAGPLLAGLVASFAPAAQTPDAATNGVYLSPASAQSGGGGRLLKARRRVGAQR
jgi:hypothetical protein